MLIKDVECLNGIAEHLVNIFMESELSHKGQVDCKHSHMWGRVDPLGLPPSTSPESSLPRSPSLLSAS